MSDGNNNQELAANGWTAVPRSHPQGLSHVDRTSRAKISVNDVKLPDSDLVRRTYEYAKQELPEKTFNHSMRVYYYGAAIVQHHLTQMKPLLETYFLTCLLHDIGTTEKNLKGTRMSFEFYGAFQALNFLQENGSSKDQAESVTEAIIRHADLGETGMITSVGQLIQLATVFDNIGANPHLIHKDTIANVVAAFPRNEWSSCFAAAMVEEMELKPWCHTTANEGFIEAVKGNTLMEPWE
ncbi:cyanamide hydratase [Melanomma pulvis-pyrius CBS 109.77]|uniref:Cyanamide hydratase n=1 Tax=Melanomma pulvis-pyrius CBS 109.77 TaxID=1314802 RepID=A0A6A6WXB2_9PLEO|nr:cyanamide hydratase [Melanomma pulvis-pyrius CBS 109.77]